MKYLLILLLSSCATSGYVGWTYPWPPSNTTKWHQVSTAQMYYLCGHNPSQMPFLAGCALQIQETSHCDIFSELSEMDAKATVLRGWRFNLYEHEMEHCRGGRHL